MKFRKDINGLRAIAVLSVVLYHFGVPGFGGGFAGVDVFFVISGFLMTGIILTRAENGTFNLAEFYLERARRIIPALAVLCMSVLAFGWFYLIPTDFNTLASHVQSSVLFYSNIDYFHNINYFDSSSKEKWLLHTWSLSVEWQFYIIYPILIMLLRKVVSERNMPFILAFFMLASLIASCHMVSVNKSSAFYLLYYRAWEMLAGGAIFSISSIIKIKRAREFKFLGILLFIGSVMLFNNMSSWPGINAVIPVFGGAIFILGCSSNFFITDNVVFQYIGKISYSVYLWHWPIFVYINFMGFDGSAYVISAIVLSFLIGSLSYHLVERPSIKILKKNSTYKYRELIFCFFVVFIPYKVSAYVLSDSGVPSRFPFALITPSQLAKERARYWVDGDKLHPIPKNGEKKIIIIGNSHGVDLTYALVENGLKGEISYLRTTNLCSNFGYTPNSTADIKHCDKVLDSVLSFKGIKDADIIIMHDNWKVVDIAGTNKILRELRSRTDSPIYVVGPKMDFEIAASEIVVEAMKNKSVNPSMVNQFAKRFYDESRFSLNKDLINFFAKSGLDKFNIYYIDALRAQCGAETKCDIISEDKKFEYFDTNHFTLEGATIFGRNLKELHPEIF